MSTPEDITAISGSTRQNDESTTQSILPTFAPVREPSDHGGDRTGSASSSSRISPGEFQRRSRGDFRESLSHRNSSGSVDYDETYVKPGRREKRSSGGFLLETAAKSSILSKSLLLRSQHDKKGKRKSDGSELSIPKRRNRNNVLEQNTSLGSSPLSIELKRDGGLFQDDIEADQNGSVKLPGQVNGTPISTNNGNPASQRSNTPIVGFDTDPAQIVDMALRLSEGRRRHLSSQRHISGETPGRRVVSMNNSVHRNNRAPSSNLGQYRASMLLPMPVTPTKDSDPDKEVDVAVEVSPSQTYPFSQPESQEMVLDISGATAIRVEKAKTYIELAYEHRRLLSHLPPIRRPDNQHGTQEHLPESRIYNPLQYARNRKLRLREKCAIGAEADGWHDVEKVRAWVDTVIKSHTETRHDPVECVRLPPLAHQQVDVKDTAESPSQNGNKSQNPPTRPKRPKSDWVTHPGTLIADAHWLEQGLNKTRIQDRDNDPIYPSNTQFKFSGWRNATPVKAQDTFQEPTPPPEDLTPAVMETPNLESPPELPTFMSAHRKPKDKERKNKPRKMRKSIAKDARSSRKRSRALHEDSLSQSSRSSSASVSNRDSQRRGRRRLGVFDLPDGDLFGRSASNAPDKLDKTIPFNSSHADLSDYNKPHRASIEDHKLIKYLRLNNARQDSQSDIERPRTPFATGSQQDLLRPAKHRNNSTDYDTTAPTSPMHEAWPSIAINLSPPPSRSPSPTKKGKHSLLHAILDRHQSQDRERIERNDFALSRSKSHSRDASTDTDKNGSSSNQRSRGTSPFTKSQAALGKQTLDLTPQDDIPPTPIEHRASTLSRTSTKSTFPGDPSRIRGIFKGGRIAEIVGNEVTRVGDFIWKRDIPASEISNRSFDGSATDEEYLPNGNLYKKRTLRRRTTSSSTKHSKDERKSLDSTENENSPQYHNPNLPSFTSPFQKDREKQVRRKDDGSPELILPTTEDHISRQAADVRSRGKSPRLDLLAPPKLDTNASRSQSADGQRRSYGFGAAINLNKPRTASQTYNDAINGNSEYEGIRTGSTAGFSGQLRNSIIEVGIPNRPQKVGKQDVARIEALLLISAVKAKGLVEVQEQIPPASSKFLIGTLSEERKAILASQPLRVRRREEHIFAARNLIATLAGQSNTFGDKLHGFSNNTVTQLHSEIQILEDTIENTLTPRVRITADNAGELSMKLTTTSTLAVKALNDIISEAFRIRKRGPLRWVRLSGYKAIEWAVVSLLWIIWAVVTSIRLFISFFKGIIWFGKWMVWAV